MTAALAYTASPINAPANDNPPRRRATKEEMEIRAQFLISYAIRHHPVTVRQLFYAATVAGVPGIEKNDNGYNKVQLQVLDLRRSGRLPYYCIADLTRMSRQPGTFDGVQDALDDTARLYRRQLWRDKDVRVEIWCEKDALAGCMWPVTAEYTIPLMICRGFASETYTYEAVEAWYRGGKVNHVYHFGDFDRSGQDAADDLEKKLMGFAEKRGVECVFHRSALTHAMVTGWSLPTREPKRESAADRRWEYDFACELDAIPPDLLRDLVRREISIHMPDEELRILKEAEKSEREILSSFADIARTQYRF